MGDYLRRLEAAMTPEQIQEAARRMIASGWRLGSFPPAFVWYIVFREVAPDVCRRVSDDIVIERAPDLFRRIDAALAKKRPTIW